MLLNVVQKQQAELAEQQRLYDQQKKLSESQAAQIVRLEASRDRDMSEIRGRELAMRTEFALELAQLKATLQTTIGAGRLQTAFK